MSRAVPEGWTNDKLSSVAVLEYGKSPNAVKDENGQYPIVGTSGLVGTANNFMWNQASVVIGRKGTIDRPIYIDTPFWAIDTTYFCKFAETTDPKWFYYKICEEALEKHNEASGVPSLSRETLKSIQLPIPPLPEQKTIASILTSVDEVIEDTQKQIDKLQDLKKATMNQLLTKGIGHTEFKDSELGRIPKSWEVCSLSDVCRKIADRDHTTPKYVSENEGVPIISPTNLDSNMELDLNKLKYISFEAHEKNWEKTDLSPNDIIFSRIGAGLGKSYLVTKSFYDFSILHSLCQIRVNENLICPRYLLWQMRTSGFQNSLWLGVQSIGVPDLGLGEIGHLKVPVCSLAEQREITKHLEKIQTNILQKKSLLLKIQSLKKSLMQDLLTGKVRTKPPEGTGL